ncbi:MAG: HD domain-containing protein [Blastocatellia bacterium]
MQDKEENKPKASFRTMKESSKDDWEIIGLQFREYAKDLPKRIISHLKLLDGDFGGFPIDRLQHSLQTATLAYKAGESEEYVVCALLHDIGDSLGSYNHADIAGAILKPFISEENHWMIEKHAIFQGYYFFHYIGLERDMREEFRGHKYFERTAIFCEKYDSCAFDKNIENIPLDFFLPMIDRIFEKPINSIYLKD